MTTTLTRIGNSRGLRIPKPLIEQCGLEGLLDMEITPEGLLIHAARTKPRQGWEAAFKKVAAAGQAALTPEDRDWLDAPLEASSKKGVAW